MPKGWKKNNHRNRRANDDNGDLETTEVTVSDPAEVVPLHQILDTFEDNIMNDANQTTETETEAQDTGPSSQPKSKKFLKFLRDFKSEAKGKKMEDIVKELNPTFVGLTLLSLYEDAEIEEFVEFLSEELGMTHFNIEELFSKDKSSKKTTTSNSSSSSSSGITTEDVLITTAVVAGVAAIGKVAYDIFSTPEAASGFANGIAEATGSLGSGI